MGEGERLRERLFDLYAGNLAAMSPFVDNPVGEGNTFLCPFCERLFDRSALSRPAKLSLEHCIPQALGGTLATCTLVCTECNNDMGSSVDAHLKGRFDAEDFFQGFSNRTRRIWVKTGDDRVRADWSIGPSGAPSFTVVCDPDNSPPGAVQALDAAFREASKAGDDVTFQVTCPLGYNGQAAKVALLRIGFLLMFRHFGYGYVLSPTVDQAREQILNPTREIIQSVLAIDLPESAEKLDCVWVVHQPAECRCFLVPVRMRTDHRTFCKGILMPGLDEQGPGIYERLPRSVEGELSFKCKSLLHQYDRQWVSEPRFALLAHRVWAHATKPRGL